MNTTTTMKKSVPWLYYLGTIGMMVGMNLSGIYLVFFMTERMGIPVLLASSITLACRIADLILAIVIGVLVQKLNPKHGQYRTWLLYGPIMIAIGTIMMFLNPPVGTTLQAIIVFIGYNLYGGGASFLQLSQNGLMSKIAGPDMSIRLTIAGKIVQGQNTAQIACSLLALPLITFLDTNTGFDGYTLAQIIFSAISLVLCFILFFNTKEYETQDPNFKGSSAKLSEMLGGVFKNSQLLIVTLADCLRYTAMLSVLMLASYYFSYVIGNMALLTMALTAQSVTGLIGSFIAPTISKRIGKKKTATLSGLICGIAYISLGLFAGPNHVIYIICSCIGLFGLSLANSLGVNLYLDTAEYQIYTSGLDNKTFTMSMLGTSIKIGNMISSVFIGVLLSTGGYVVAADGAASMSNPAQFGRFFGIAIGAFYLLYMLIITFVYKITDEKAAEYAMANHENAAAKVAKKAVV